jgi:hypothetical protein
MQQNWPFICDKSTLWCWNLQGVRAAKGLMIKRLLTKYKYPPEGMDDAVLLVVKQAEVLAEEWGVIYEAAFQHDGVLAALDILVRDGAGCLTSWSSIPYRHAMNGVRPTSFIVLTFA